jgi:hypothetical protein
MRHSAHTVSTIGPLAEGHETAEHMLPVNAALRRTAQLL